MSGPASHCSGHAPNGRGLIAAALLAVAALGSQVLEVPAPSRGPDGAFIDCPCIDHVSNGSSWAETLERHDLVLASGELSTHFGPAVRSYGSTQCLAFDGDGRGPYTVCNGQRPKPWCKERWCYVDPANCVPQRSPRPSQALPGLHFSFHACGSVDTFRHNTSTVAQSLAPIYVNALGFDVFAGPRTSIQLIEDITMEFTGDALQHLGFTAEQVTYRAVSPDSLAAHNSSFTACVHDIAVGHLDICTGAYWDTVDRRALGVPFASTLLTESVYLYARQERVDSGFWSMVLKPTKAFSPGLWGLIVAVLLGSGLVLAVLERKMPEGDFEAATRPGRVLQGWFHAGATFMSGGLSYTPQTTAAKVFSLGLGFFVLIAVASFTANTASILIAEQRAPKVNDLATALLQGRRVCAPSALRQTIGVVHPLMDTLGVYNDYETDGYYAGACELVIAPEFAMRHFHSLAQLCELSPVGKPLVSFPVSLFVSERLRAALDVGLTEKRADGTWYLLERALSSQGRCPERAAVEGTSMELKVQHMTGNCILLGFSLGVAIVLRALQHVEASESMQSVEHLAKDSVTAAAETLHNVERHARRSSVTAIVDAVLEHLSHDRVSELRRRGEGDDAQAPHGGVPRPVEQDPTAALV